MSHILLDEREHDYETEDALFQSGTDEEVVDWSFLRVLVHCRGYGINPLRTCVLARRECW
jgi:hypothetical protein